MLTAQMDTSVTLMHIQVHRITRKGPWGICSQAPYGRPRGQTLSGVLGGIDLFSELLDNRIYACGTLRTNHLQFPDELKPLTKKGLKKHGKSEVHQAGSLVVSIWQDNRPMTMLSTNAQASATVTVQRRHKDGSRTEVPCPESVVL